MWRSAGPTVPESPALTPRTRLRRHREFADHGWGGKLGRNVPETRQWSGTFGIAGAEKTPIGQERPIQAIDIATHRQPGRGATAGDIPDLVAGGRLAVAIAVNRRQTHTVG